VFQFSQWHVVEDWLSKETDSNRRELMLEWMITWAENPLDQAFRIPGVRGQMYLVVVPLPGEPAVIKFGYAGQFHTLVIVEIDTL